MKSDEMFMREALNEASLSAEKGEVPVGAVVVSGDKIVSRGHNVSIASMDPTSHAEIEAIRKACRMRENHRIPDCELYVTLEPCAMCLGAAIQARLSRLVFGAHDPKAGAVESLLRFPLERTNHKMEIRGGVLEKECGRILKDFFQKRR